MRAIVDTSVLIEKKRSTPCLHASDDVTESVIRRGSDEKMDMVYISSKFVNPDVHRRRSRSKEGKHIGKTMSDQYALSKFGDEYNVECETEDTMTVTVKLVVPDELHKKLDEIHFRSCLYVKEMLKDREKNSSKYYKEIPCVVAKSLIAKYQRNKKCKSVKNVVLPISGDKGRQIKLVDGGFRIPSIFGKEVIHHEFEKPIVGTLRGAEFFRRKGRWFVSISYNTPRKELISFRDVVGVDRNSRGNIAVASSLSTGKVVKLGIDAGAFQYNWRKRRGHLQAKGKLKFCKKLSGRQSRRITHENHKVSRSIVDFAKSHCSAIVLENLSGVRKGKIRSYTEKSQWSFFQLQEYICYKAALLGIPVFFVNPAYTSKKCSRCGTINTPNNKVFRCKECNHFDHRDVNAAFNVAQTFVASSFRPSVSEVRHIGKPQTIQESSKFNYYGHK